MSSFFINFPVIDLGRVKLREIKTTDLESFYDYIIHPKVTAFLAAEDTPTDLESAKKELLYWYNLYRTYSSIYWAIANADDVLIGTCGFNVWNRYHKRAELSYDLAVDYWGKGIMTTVVKNVTQFAFKHMDVRRVQATVSVDNIGSKKVLEKCGYVDEGIMQNYGILNGKSTDFHMYSIAKEI